MKNKFNAIQVNGLRFVRNASLLVDSLFNPGGTASGMFKVRKHSVLFMRPDGSPFACLVANRGQSPFFVSCGMAPQHGAPDALVFAYALSTADETALGLADMAYGQKGEIAERVWRSVQTALEVAA